MTRSAECIDACREHGVEAIEAACAEALAGGVGTAAVVLNHLARRHQPPPPEMLTGTPALTLPPAADCGRYDLLRREVGHGTA